MSARAAAVRSDGYFFCPERENSGQQRSVVRAQKGENPSKSGLVFGSVCSGIEAASVAWHPLGWRAAFLSEIEAFPRAVLKHHYPETPLHGDFTTIEAGEYEPIDLLVGGTPCQDFSVAGLRAGMAGDRGNLTLQFLTLARRLRPLWLVWENVPGVLSSNGGRDFGAFLGGLGELGYGWAYRTLDAQHLGVPQRRRRVFVVGHLGDWRRAAAVLFERHSLSGNPPPRRKAGEDAAKSLRARAQASHREDSDTYIPVEGYSIALGACNKPGGREDIYVSRSDMSRTLDCTGADPTRAQGGTMITHSLRADGFDASEDGTGRGTPLVPVYPINTQVALRHEALGEATGFGIGAAGDPSFTLQREHHHAVAFSCKDHGADAGDLSPTLRAMGHDGSHANAGGQLAVAFTASEQANSYAWEREVYPTLNAQIPNDTSNIQQGIRQGMAVRRLTPRERCRLQGFPDDYLDVIYRGKPAADGPKYKALGNSFAVPVISWIGQRIQMVEGLSCTNAKTAT